MNEIMNSSFNVFATATNWIKQSRKLCLNLWSLRWLERSLSLLISFILIGLWQLGIGRMNCKMLFLKRARLWELFILLSRLFHSIAERALKKIMFDIEHRIVADVISCSVCWTSGGDFIKEILRGLSFSYLKKIAKFSKPPPLL